MKAIGLVISQDPKNGRPARFMHAELAPDLFTPYDTRPEQLAKAAEESVERERSARIRAGLIDFYNLDPSKVAELKYETGLLKRRKDGVDVPEMGALLTYTDVRFTDGTEASFTMLVDEQTHAPQELRTDLGFVANRDAARGDYYDDIITPESDAYYTAARTQTETYMALYRGRITGAIALQGPQPELSVEATPILTERVA